MAMPRRPTALLLAALGSLFCPSPGRAQNVFISGGAGLSAGDGGTAPVFDAAAGFEASRVMAFEIAFAGSPGLDFGRRELGGTTLPFPGGNPFVFPPLVTTTTGNVYALHGNVVARIVKRGRMSVSLHAGGGVSTVERRMHVTREAVTFPGFPDFPGLPGVPNLPTRPGLGSVLFEPIGIPRLDETRHSSQSGLSLTGGARLDFRLNRHVGIGGAVGYDHVFITDGFDVVRTTARVTWWP